MPRLIRLVLLVAGCAVLVGLAWRTGTAAVVEMLERAGWAFVWVLALYALHVALRAYALWRCLPLSGLRFRDILRVRLAGEAIEMLTFTGPFLAEPSKGWLLKRYGVETAVAFGAIAVEYLLYTAVAFWMAGVALATLLHRGVLGDAAERPIQSVLVAVGVFTAGLMFATVTRKGLIVPGGRSISRLLGLPAWLHASVERVAPVEEVLVAFLHDRPARLLEVLVAEAASHALLAAEIWLVLRAIGASPSWSDAFVMEGAIKLIPAVFFFVPGQLGAAEGVYVLLGETLTFGSAAGLTLALIRRLRALIVAGAGLLTLAALPEPADGDAHATVRGLSP